MTNHNPYAPGENLPQSSRPENDPASLTTTDWVIAIVCSGIGCIVGIVRLIQGKKNAGKMIGVSLLAALFWNILRFAIAAAMQAAGGP